MNHDFSNCSFCNTHTHRSMLNQNVHAHVTTTCQGPSVAAIAMVVAQQEKYGTTKSADVFVPTETALQGFVSGHIIGALTFANVFTSILETQNSRIGMLEVMNLPYFFYIFEKVGLFE